MVNSCLHAQATGFEKEQTPKPHTVKIQSLTPEETNEEAFRRTQVSYSLNALKGGYIGDNLGSIIGLTKGYTRSLDYKSSEILY